MLDTFNLLIFNFINGGAGYYQGLDLILVFFTRYLAYVASISVMVYFAIWKPLKAVSLPEKLKAAYLGFQFVLAVTLTWIIIKMIKVVVAYPRPFETLENINVLLQKTGGDSFPSGHAGLTMSVATMAYFYKPKLGVLLFVFAFLIAISRIYVGVHYPIDVVIGMLIGFLVPALVHTLFVKRNSPVT